MKVLHLNTYDTIGGAARATYRLHNGLRSYGVDSRLLVQRKDSDNKSVYGSEGRLGKIRSTIRNKLDQLPVKRYRNRDSEPFSPAWVPDWREKQIAQHDPDIVHLHWITGGFLKPATIGELDVPVVWTLHDMWPFTGGCHYAKECEKYRTECRACPQLDSEQSEDLANAIWERKHSAWQDSDFTVVTPSQWLAQEAEVSSLLGGDQIKVIPNGLDIDIFKPRDKSKGVQRFDLESNNYYILFGAAYGSSRKGGALFREALEKIPKKSKINVLTFGGVDTKNQSLPLPVRDLGRLSEEDLHWIYSTVDLTVVPSKEDNLPNIAVESIASGTPCVAFNVGGLPDIIDHLKTGYLAEPFNTDDLANGIEWVVNQTNQPNQLGKQARHVAEQKFAIEKVVNQYSDLYNRLL